MILLCHVSQQPNMFRSHLPTHARNETVLISVAGVLRDQFGSYKYAFFSSGAIFLLTTIGYEIYCLVVVRDLFRRRVRNQRKDAESTVT